jgi:predicted DNA-binding protein
MQTISFQAPEEMNKALEGFAKELDRSKAYLIRQAVADFLEDLEDVARVKRYKASYDPSENIAFDEVKRRLELP